MKMLFGKRNSTTTADGITFWIEGRRRAYGSSMRFTSVVFWTRPTFKDGYWNEVVFNKPRPSAKEVQEVVDAARLAVIEVGGTFRHYNGPIFTVLEKVEGGVKATYTEEPINQIFNVPASCIAEVLS